MKKTSWEIVVAGFLLLIVAVFITSKKEDSDQANKQEDKRVAQVIASEEADRIAASQKVRVINIEELAKIEDLHKLSGLKSLEGLHRLKTLANLIPDSAKNDIIAELNEALSELENDSFSININIDDNLVLLKKEYETKEGEWSSVSPGVYAYTQEFNASKLKDISVQLTSGSIVLIGSDNDKATFTVKASGDISSREALDDAISVSTLNKESSAEFSISNFNNEDSNINLQTTLILPSSLNIISSLGVGHIEATNFKGDLEFKTSGGHITLKDLKGDITAYTKGGHIKISNIVGDISLESLGGHLTASNVSGVLEMKTNGGDIKGKEISGEVNVFTNAGNIQLELISVGGQIQARNGAGQIDLMLPANVSASLTSNGTKVELDSRFDFKGDIKKGQIVGKIGSGEFPIIAKTGYGTVSIKKND